MVQIKTRIGNRYFTIEVNQPQIKKPKQVPIKKPKQVPIKQTILKNQFKPENKVKRQVTNGGVVSYYSRKGKMMPESIKMWQPSEKDIKKLENTIISFPKPDNWDTLPLYEKSRVYGLQLGQKEAFYADKLAIKDLVNLKTAPIVKILSNVNDITQNDINPNHYLKGTHGSGWNIDFAKDNNLISIRQKLKRWNRNYNPDKEPHYRLIRPRFLIEEKVKDKTHPNFLITYRFRCIRGVPIAIRVTVEEKLYDYFPDWTPMKDNPKPDFPRPAELEDMLRIAEKMSGEFEYVRIDLYLTVDGIYFSEYTFTPNAYDQIYYDDLEMKLGKLWIK